MGKSIRIGHLQSLSDRRIDQILEKERKRFAAQEAVIEKLRRRALRSRERLVVTINRNHRTTSLT